MVFGLTAEGFNPKRLADAKLELEEAFREAFGSNVRVDADSLNGQFIGIMSEQIGDGWEGLEDVYASGLFGLASGAALDDQVALAGIKRNPATFSEVTLVLSGTPGTLCEAGRIVSDPEVDTPWLTAADATIGAGGTIEVAATPETAGPTLAVAGSLTVIDTPVSGWVSVVNPLDADPGQAEESDAALRVRYFQSFKAGLGSAADAVRARLLDLDGVLEAIVIENDSAFADADGRPPHTFESVVRGGADQEIINKIWQCKPSGIEPWGLTFGTALDALGVAHSVGYTRGSEIEIWIAIDYRVKDEHPDDVEDLVLAEIIDFGTAYTLGQNVVPFEIVQHIETTGILTLELYVGIGPSPVTSDPIEISRRHLAALDSSRITFNRLN